MAGVPRARGEVKFISFNVKRVLLDLQPAAGTAALHAAGLPHFRRRNYEDDQRRHDVKGPGRQQPVGAQDGDLEAVLGGWLPCRGVGVRADGCEGGVGAWRRRIRRQ